MPIIKQATDTEIRQYAVDAKQFINDYIHSKGFAKRLSLLTPDYNVNKNFKINPTFIISDKRSYAQPFNSNGKVYITPDDEQKYYWEGYNKADVYDRFGSVDFPLGLSTTHEYGHILDAKLADENNFVDKNPWYVPSKHLNTVRYHSDRYPQLIPNKTVNSHDKSAQESYADLIAFRKYLKDNKIYDSGSTIDFDNRHLKKVKEKAKQNDDFLRLLHNFTDSEIINIMNTVAYNNSNKKRSLELAGKSQV